MTRRCTGHHTFLGIFYPTKDVSHHPLFYSTSGPRAFGDAKVILPTCVPSSLPQHHVLALLSVFTSSNSSAGVTRTLDKHWQSCPVSHDVNHAFHYCLSVLPSVDRVVCSAGTLAGRPVTTPLNRIAFFPGRLHCFDRGADPLSGCTPSVCR